MNILSQDDRSLCVCIHCLPYVFYLCVCVHVCVRLPSRHTLNLSWKQRVQFFGYTEI